MGLTSGAFIRAAPPEEERLKGVNGFTVGAGGHAEGCSGTAVASLSTTVTKVLRCIVAAAETETEAETEVDVDTEAEAEAEAGPPAGVSSLTTAARTGLRDLPGRGCASLGRGPGSSSIPSFPLLSALRARSRM